MVLKAKPGKPGPLGWRPPAAGSMARMVSCPSATPRSLAHARKAWMTSATW
jgi:hypothetical protein